MFDVTPQGKVYEQIPEWIKKAEANSFCHWVVYEQPDGSEFRALYNGLSYWAKVFRFLKDGSLIYLFDISTIPETDEEAGETYLPSVSEGSIRDFLGWEINEPISYR